MNPRGLLFDLFGTVVFFAPRVPTVQVAGAPWRSAMQWLRDAAERELPEIAFDDLLPTLMRVTDEIVQARPPEYFEVPSRERFRRVLVRLGVAETIAPAVAERLSQAHMAQLAAMTVLPLTHAGVLRTLAARCPLGLVSNFDHAPTARRVLADHDVARFFSTIVISDEFGRRKPHPSIFEEALRALDVSPEDALFVGDSVSDDIAGARNAGLRIVWLNAKGEALPPGAPAPDYIIARLGELPALL
jgi:HAD superfamily hydrolase (TIGR01509 family)